MDSDEERKKKMTEQQNYFKSQGVPLDVVDGEIRNVNIEPVGFVSGDITKYQLATDWSRAVYQSKPDIIGEIDVIRPTSVEFAAGLGSVTIENMSDDNADIKQTFYVTNNIVANKNGAVFFDDNIVSFDQNYNATKDELAERLSQFGKEMETVHGLAAQNKDDVIQKLDSADFNPGYGENYIPFYEYSKVEYTSRLVNLVKDLDAGQIDLDGSSDRIELTTPDNILVDFQSNEKDGKSYALVEITGVNRNGEGSRFITGGLNTAVTDRPRALQVISEETFAHDVTEFINNYRIFKESCKECSQKLSDDIRVKFENEPTLTMDDLVQEDSLTL